jgi:DNA-binding NarL/FixJ family response regulator
MAQPTASMNGTHPRATEEVSKPKARVLVVDGEPIVCEALAQLISRAPNLSVVGALTEGRSVLATARQCAPDVVLLDLLLPDCDALELIGDLKAEFPQVPVLVLCTRAESSHAERTIRAGASGYVMKTESALDLFEAIACVLGGHMRLSARISAILLDRLLVPARPSASGSDGHDCSELSDRELRVFEMIGAGLSTREIAGRLGRSVKTIESHREHIKAKLGLKSGAQMATRASEWLRSNNGAPR